jgi:FKBP-type peptidyl-prolyl cis-trans isomerase FkpA
MDFLSNRRPALAPLIAFSALIITPIVSAAGSGVATPATPSAPAPITRPHASLTQAEQDEVLYALGVLISHNLDEFDLSSSDFDRVKSGLIDAFNHRATGFDLIRDGAKIQALRGERLARLKTKRQEAGREFLDRIAAQAGARRTTSGVVYVPLREGNGASPGPDDGVIVNYEGRLIDGAVFDGSQLHGGPSTFSLRSVISCWSEALPLMKVGGKSRITCPAALAYGVEGEPPKVGPDATLDFEVELLGVTPSARGGSPGGNQ